MDLEFRTRLFNKLEELHQDVKELKEWKRTTESQIEELKSVNDALRKENLELKEQIANSQESSGIEKGLEQLRVNPNTLSPHMANKIELSESVRDIYKRCNDIHLDQYAERLDCSVVEYCWEAVRLDSVSLPDTGSVVIKYDNKLQGKRTICEMDIQTGICQIQYTREDQYHYIACDVKQKGRGTINWYLYLDRCLAKACTPVTGSPEYFERKTSDSDDSDLGVKIATTTGDKPMVRSWLQRWNCYEGTQFWVEAEKVEGNAEVEWCRLYGIAHMD